MRSVLIIDDDPLIRKTLSGHLSKQGFDVQLAEEGEEAIRKFKESNPDVVILDVRLPDLDGIEVLRQIRELNKKTYVLMMTAYDDMKTTIEAVKLGAFEYLVKPLNYIDLDLTVAKAFQVRALEQKVRYIFIYPLLPWIGVMLVGYGTAAVFEWPSQRRDATLLVAGLAITTAFFVLRAIDVYGDPNPWQPQPSGFTATVIDFLNTTKYPPSLAFMTTTLGPAMMLCAFADRITGAVKDGLVMFGRVPFAFYIAHFYLIHTLGVALGVAQGFDARQMMTWVSFYPTGYGVPLAGVYAVWVLVLAILYPFCRWVASVKARRRDWWLSYL